LANTLFESGTQLAFLFFRKNLIPLFGIRRERQRLNSMTRKPTNTKSWLLTLVLLLWAVIPALSVAAPSVRVLEQRHASARSGKLKLDQQRFQLLGKVHKAAALITRLKADIKRGGFFGLPARLRLRYVRSKAQSLARQMEALEKRLTQQKQQVRRWRTRLNKAYLTKLKTLVKRHNSVSSKTDKTRFKKEMRRLRDRLRRLNPAKRGKKRTLRLVMPKLNELDGPDELKQKTDALRDLEDRINKRLSKLRRRAHRLQRKAKQVKQDRNLLNDVNDMIQDDQVFDENSRRPRAVNNQPLQKKQNGPAGLLSGGAANRSPSPTKGKTDSASGGSGYNGAAPGDKSREQTPSVGNGGGNDPSTGVAPPTTPTPSTPQTSQQQRLSHLPGNPLSQKLQEPRWKGTPSQQLKALKLYKRRLLRQLQQVMKSKRQFKKRAKQLKKLDKRRKR
jgi:hypothetical protein